MEMVWDDVEFWLGIAEQLEAKVRED